VGTIGWPAGPLGVRRPISADLTWTTLSKALASLCEGSFQPRSCSQKARVLASQLARVYAQVDSTGAIIPRLPLITRK
jgi:hypothetical protein